MATPRRSADPKKATFICVFASTYPSGAVELQNQHQWHCDVVGGVYDPTPDHDDDYRQMRYESGAMRVVHSFEGDAGIQHLLSVASEVPSDKHVLCATLFSKGAIKAVVLNDVKHGEAVMVRPFVGFAPVLYRGMPVNVADGIIHNLPLEVDNALDSRDGAPYAGFVGRVGGTNGLPYPDEAGERGEVVGQTYALYPRGFGAGFDVDRMDKLSVVTWRFGPTSHSSDKERLRVGISGSWDQRVQYGVFMGLGRAYLEGYNYYFTCPMPISAITHAELEGPFGLHLGRLLATEIRGK